MFLLCTETDYFGNQFCFSAFKQLAEKQNDEVKAEIRPMGMLFGVTVLQAPFLAAGRSFGLCMSALSSLGKCKHIEYLIRFTLK